MFFDDRSSRSQGSEREDRQSLLSRTRAERERRQDAQRREGAAGTVQRWWRARRAQRAAGAEIRLSISTAISAATAAKQPIPSSQLVLLARRALFVHRPAAAPCGCGSAGSRTQSRACAAKQLSERLKAQSSSKDDRLALSVVAVILQGAKAPASEPAPESPLSSPNLFALAASPDAAVRALFVELVSRLVALALSVLERKAAWLLATARAITAQERVEARAAQLQVGDSSSPFPLSAELIAWQKAVKSPSPPAPSASASAPAPQAAGPSVAEQVQALFAAHRQELGVWLRFIVVACDCSQWNSPVTPLVGPAPARVQCTNTYLQLLSRMIFAGSEGLFLRGARFLRACTLAAELVDGASPAASSPSSLASALAPFAGSLFAVLLRLLQAPAAVRAEALSLGAGPVDAAVDCAGRWVQSVLPTPGLWRLIPPAVLEPLRKDSFALLGPLLAQLVTLSPLSASPLLAALLAPARDGAACACSVPAATGSLGQPPLAWLASNVVALADSLQLVSLAPVQHLALLVTVHSNLLELLPPRVAFIGHSAASKSGQTLPDPDSDDEKTDDPPAPSPSALDSASSSALRAVDRALTRRMRSVFGVQFAGLFRPSNLCGLLARALRGDRTPDADSRFCGGVWLGAQSLSAQELASFRSFLEHHPFYLQAATRLILTAYRTCPPQRFAMLSALAFSSPTAALLWHWLQNASPLTLPTGSKSSDPWWLRWEAALAREDLADTFGLFCLVLNQQLLVLEDDDFVNSNSVFGSRDALLLFCRFTKVFVFRCVRAHALSRQLSLSFLAVDPEDSEQKVFAPAAPSELMRLPLASSAPAKRAGLFSFGAKAPASPEALSLPPLDSELFRGCGRLVHEFFRRDVRLAYCPPEYWTIDAAEDPEWHAFWAKREKQRKDAPSDISLAEVDEAVLQHVPFVIPFEQRVRLLRQTIAIDTQLTAGATYELNIRRSRLVEDGFDRVARLGPKFRNKIKVVFLDDSGEREAGIDLGGPFKEFLELMIKEVFNPNFALFRATPSGHFFPNAAAVKLLPDAIANMGFIGRLVGKALLEGILVDVPFASFFLCKLLSQPTFFTHLRALDPDLHKNLLFLKSYDGDVEDLGLTFTVTENEFGQVTEIPLVPNGRNINVTNSNRIQYVYQVANYHLNDKIRGMTEAFKEGMAEMINLRWIQMFSVNELQILLSGTAGDIDVDDWRENTQYDRVSPNNEVVRWFWRAVAEMTGEERQALLRFVTSCSRPPLMGFKYLQPAFTIRLVPATHDQDDPGFFSRMFSSSVKSKASLPTSATCFNLLKLPAYSSKDVLAQKLKQAIAGNTGFHLT